MNCTANAPTARPFSTAPYAQYELYKAVWKSNNFPFTSQQYEAAMRAIARECGV